jgi:hypothetical protein
VDNFFIHTIIKFYIESTAYGNNKLLQCPVSVATPIFATGHIIQVINPLNVEWGMKLILNSGNITGPVMNFGQLHYAALVNAAFHDFLNWRYWSKSLM